MREIKFRAWDKDNSEMFTYDNMGDVFFGLENNGTVSLFICDSEESPSVDIMQFTGLQDKNGVDIYEGDIVQYLDEYNDEPSIHFVQYLGDKGYPAFELSPELGFECNGFAGIYQGGSGHIIVIGNIHQNPELLESKK